MRKDEGNDQDTMNFWDRIFAAMPQREVKETIWLPEYSPEIARHPAPGIKGRVFRPAPPGSMEDGQWVNLVERAKVGAK